MLPYISIFIFLFLFTLYEQFFRLDKCTSLYIYVIFSIFIILFVGFRQCGFDYENYYFYFKHLNSVHWENNSEVLGAEKGYAFLNYLIGDYRGVLLCISLVTVSLIFSFLYKYSPDVYFSLFLFFAVSFYPMVMGQYRQGLAVAIILWAFIVKKESIVLFLLMVFIASLFHLSAFLAIMALFVPYFLLKRKYYILILLSAFLFSEFGKTFFYNVVWGGSDFIVRKVAIYAESEADLRLGLNTAMLLRVVIFCIFYINRKRIVSYPQGAYFLNLYFVSLLVYLGLGFFPQLAGRGSAYFYLFEFILSAMVIRNLPVKRRLLFLLLFVCISLYRYHTFLISGFEDYVPYSWGISYFKL